MTDVSAWRRICASNEESGRHACMNAHLTNAAAPNTKCEVIGVRKKIIIVNMGIINVVMYNPVILKKDSPYETEEGCLSLTGVRKTIRYENIEVEYLDSGWKKHRQKFSGWTAQIIQHEVDYPNLNKIQTLI